MDQLKDNSKEIWKEYVFDEKIENNSNYKLEVSNLGRIKTYTKFHPEGKVIKGSSVGGYPCVRVTFYRSMLPKYREILQPLYDEIEALNAQIKELRKADAVTKRKRSYVSNLNTLVEKRDKLVARRKKNTSKYARKSYQQVVVLIHKAVASLFLPPPKKNQKFVIHKDWSKTNNHVDNLQWASQAEVSKHQFSNPKIELEKFKDQLAGIKRKPNTKMGKLKENDVLFIKRKLKKGDTTLKTLAKRFGVSDMQIHRIKTGENWGHVKEVSELLQEQRAAVAK